MKLISPSLQQQFPGQILVLNPVKTKILSYQHWPFQLMEFQQNLEMQTETALPVQFQQVNQEIKVSIE